MGRLVARLLAALILRDVRQYSPTVIASAICLLLLASGLVVGTLGLTAPAHACLVFFAVFGTGTAILMVAGYVENAVVFAVPVSVVIYILVGFALVELRLWQVGAPLVLILNAFAAAAHATYLTRAMPGLLTKAQTLMRRSGAARTYPRLGNHYRRKPLPFGGKLNGVSKGLLARLRSRLRWPLAHAVFSAASASLCLVGAIAVTGAEPRSPAGLFASLPLYWYIGMALLLVATLLALALDCLTVSVPFAAIAIVVLFTPAVVYPDPQTPWAIKHIGVVAYILQYHSVQPGIDIYQSWPGLFAGVALLCHSIGIADPIVIARWWPPVIDLASLLVFRAFARRMLGRGMVSDGAALLFLLGNTLSQDYFSPQAAGYLLAITTFALIVTPPGHRLQTSFRHWLALTAITVADSVTHQLSPYMVLGVAVVLLAGGMLRQAYMVAVIALPPVIWALVNVSVVERYFSVSQIGAVTTNLLPVGFVRRGYHKSLLIHLNAAAMGADTAILLVMAGLTLLLYRDRPALVFALCSGSGIALLAANSYGNEGDFRIALFGLPWLAALSSRLLWRHQAPHGAGRRRLYVAVSRFAVVLFMLLCYVEANYGLAYMKVVRPSDLAAVRYFETHAAAGAKLYTLGSYTPVRLTARYWLFRYFIYYTFPASNATDRQVASSVALFTANVAGSTTRGEYRAGVYALAADQPAASSAELGLVTSSIYRSFVRAMRSSQYWKVVDVTPTAMLFRLHAPAGRR